MDVDEAPEHRGADRHREWPAGSPHLGPAAEPRGDLERDSADRAWIEVLLNFEDERLGAVVGPRDLERLAQERRFAVRKRHLDDRAAHARHAPALGGWDVSLAHVVSGASIGPGSPRTWHCRSRVDRARRQTAVVIELRHARP